MINTIHVGIGPLGQKLVKFAVERGCFNIVGAVDNDPEKAGKELGKLCGIKPLGINISNQLDDVIRNNSTDVALVTTVSNIISMENQIIELAKAKLNIVSTCEELFFPWITHPDVADRIDKICRDNGVVCIGTGVNPGYMMDLLPSVLTGICQKVEKVEVWRVQDASARRIPFQHKIGAGLTLEEFEGNKSILRHVGLTESVDFIANTLCWKLDRHIESIEPIIADKEIYGGYKPIAKGMVCGVHQVGKGLVNDREMIVLNFRAAVGEPESYDRVEIIGEPNVQFKIPGGVNGDIATCAIVLNSVRSVLKADPGLKTMSDIPPVAFFKEQTTR